MSGVAFWAIILSDYIFLKKNGEVYTDFLENIPATIELKNIPLDLRINMWMQHDSAPAHSVRISRLKMQNIFSQKWIGRGHTVCSPDLTPFDYFL